MKAKEFVKWFISNQIENTELDYIEVPEGDDFQSQEEFLKVFFGTENIKRHIPAGDYVYIWWTANNSDALLSVLDNVEIVLHNGEDSIYLFRIED